MKFRNIGVILFFLLLLVNVSAADIDNEVLKQVNEDGIADVIIILEDTGDVKQVQEEFLEDIDVKEDISIFGMSFEEKNYDLEIDHQYETISAVAGEITGDGLERLLDNPAVKEVVVDRINTIFLSESVPAINASNILPFNNQQINGTHESVCVIDTGVNYTHQSFGGCTDESFLAGTCNKIIHGYDFCADNSNCDTEDSVPEDVHGHGTTVSGIIASADATYTGVAPGASIVSMKACNSGGSCRDSDVLSSMEWCITNSTKLNISVISLSLGAGQYSSYCDASVNSQYASLINQAVGKNVSVVIATGNTNVNYPSATGGIATPSCIYNATRVSAIDKLDHIENYAFRHANFPDILFAPGSGIVSTHLSGGFSSAGSGTSYSSPHVAGIVALLQQYNKLVRNVPLTPMQIKQVLNLTGKKLTDSSTGTDFSRVNANASITSLDETAPQLTFISPTPDNQTLTSKNVTINISASEILMSAILEWGGINETMNGGGYSFDKQKTNLAKGNHTFKIFGSDFIENIGVSEERTITVSNSLPTVGSVTVNPTTAYTVDNLTCENGTVDDIDNDAVALYYQWYKNTVDQNMTTQVLFSNITVKNDVWHCGIAPDDSYELGNQINSSTVTILNSMPSAAEVYSPLFNYSNNSTVHFNWSTSTDDDNDSVNYFLIATTNSSFQYPMINVSVNGTNFTQGLNERAYYWRVDTCDGDDCSSSSINSFDIDMTPPEITVPAITINDSFSIINFSVTERNLAECNYTLQNSTTELSAAAISNGTREIYLSELLDGAYELTVSCVDHAENSKSATNSVTVSDVTIPTVSLTTSSSGTSSVTISLTATTNEPATCKYGTTNNDFSSLLDMNAGNRTHSVSNSYSDDTTGTYFVRCRDNNNNTMNSSATIEFTADVEEEEEEEEEAETTEEQPAAPSAPSAGGGGGGGSGSSDNGESVEEQQEDARQQLLDAFSRVDDEEESLASAIPMKEIEAFSLIQGLRQTVYQLQSENYDIAELEDLLDNAQDYSSDGNFDDAIQVVEQAMVLATRLRNSEPTEPTGKTVISDAGALTGAAIFDRTKSVVSSIPVIPIAIGVVVIIFGVFGYFLFFKPAAWESKEIMLWGRRK